MWDAYKTIGRNEGMMNGLYRGSKVIIPYIAMNFPSQTHFPLIMIDNHRHVPQHRSQLHYQRGRNCCLRFRQRRLHLLWLFCRRVFDSSTPRFIAIFAIWILSSVQYPHLRRFKCHLASAAVAGVTATLVASPVDVVKTRWGWSSVMLNVFIVQTHDNYILLVLLQVSKYNKTWWAGTWTQNEVGIAEPSIVPKSLSELRAPGDSSNSLFYIHFALRKFVFFSCGMKRVRSVNRHIFILGALRESIVQHQKHFITCFETCLLLSPGTFEIASTQLS